MRKFAYRKLLRDNILADMISLGEKPEYHVLTDQDYLVELKQKILEEGAEIALDDHDKLLSELADLQEIIDCMLAEIGKSQNQLKETQLKKNKRWGSFGKRIFVDTVQIPAGNPWIKYLESNPDRYPEIKPD